MQLIGVCDVYYVRTSSACTAVAEQCPAQLAVGLRPYQGFMHLRQATLQITCWRFASTPQLAFHRVLSVDSTARRQECSGANQTRASTVQAGFLPKPEVEMFCSMLQGCSYAGEKTQHSVAVVAQASAGQVRLVPDAAQQ